MMDYYSTIGKMNCAVYKKMDRTTYHHIKWSKPVQKKSTPKKKENNDLNIKGELFREPMGGGGWKERVMRDEYGRSTLYAHLKI
jgi:hypothetical protein